jgi:hypothetical protein
MSSPFSSSGNPRVCCDGVPRSVIFTLSESQLARFRVVSQGGRAGPRGDGAGDFRKDGRTWRKVFKLTRLRNPDFLPTDVRLVKPATRRSVRAPTRPSPRQGGSTSPLAMWPASSFLMHQPNHFSTLHSGDSAGIPVRRALRSKLATDKRVLMAVSTSRHWSPIRMS